MEENRLTRGRIIPILTATRPVNQSISVLAVLAGWIISTDKVIPDPDPGLFLLMLSAFYTAGGANILNDIMDRRVDIRAHPHRAISSGIMSVSIARILSIGQFIAGLIAVLISSLIGNNPIPIVIFTIVIILDLLYETWGKQRGIPGNIIVSIIVAASFPFGASLHGINGTVMIIFTVAALANISRELIKDVEDMDGDSVIRNTLPMRLGERRVLNLGAAFLGLAILSGLTIYLVRSPNQIFTLAFICVNLILITAIWNTFRDVGKAQILIKVGMALAVFSFILLPI